MKADIRVWTVKVLLADFAARRTLLWQRLLMTISKAVEKLLTHLLLKVVSAGSQPKHFDGKGNGSECLSAAAEQVAE